MNEKILKAIKSLKDEIDSLKQEKKEDLDLELIKEKITKMIQGYHIKDKHWYYDNFDTGIVAEGKEGPMGPKGEPFRFEDFTPEQLLLLMGAQGEPGRDGRDGKNGKDGKDGKDGRDGNPGRDGKPGKDGKDGITPEFVVRSVKHVPTQTPPKFEMEKIDNTYYIDIEIPRGKVGAPGKDGINGSGSGGSGEGTTDHSKLKNLSYADSGHTGFASSEDLKGKLDIANVKKIKNTTEGNVYDVTYINTMLGDIETLLSEV